MIFIDGSVRGVIKERQKMCIISEFWPLWKHFQLGLKNIQVGVEKQTVDQCIGLKSKLNGLKKLTPQLNNLRVKGNLMMKLLKVSQSATTKFITKSRSFMFRPIYFGNNFVSEVKFNPLTNLFKSDAPTRP